MATRKPPSLEEIRKYRESRGAFQEPKTYDYYPSPAPSSVSNGRKYIGTIYPDPEDTAPQALAAPAAPVAPKLVPDRPKPVDIKTLPKTVTPKSTQQLAVEKFNQSMGPNAGTQQAADKYKSLLKTEQKPGVGQWLGANAMAGGTSFNRNLAATADWVLPDFLTPKFVQKGLDYYKDQGERFSQYAAKVNEASNTGMVGGLFQNLVSMAPNAILAAMSGGGSLAAQAPNAAAATGTLASAIKNTVFELAKKPTFWLSASRIIGPEYESAKADGASELQAQATGIISGLLQAGVEVSGGIETFGEGAGGVKGWVKTMLDEGKEEVVQGVIENLTRKAMFDHDAPYASLSDSEAVLNPKRAVQEFAGGAIAGGILGGAQSGIAKLARLPRAGGVESRLKANVEASIPATQAETPILRPKGLEGMQSAAEAKKAVQGQAVASAPQSPKANTELATRAKQEFGTTSNPHEAGYVLDDGKMLDFSGQRDGGPPDVRHMDHRDIQDLYDDIQGTEAMSKFMDDTGAVRISVDKNGYVMIDVTGNKPLTESQIVKLRQLSARKNSVVVDYYATSTQSSPTLNREFDFPNVSDVDATLREIQRSQQMQAATPEPTPAPIPRGDAPKVEAPTVKAEIPHEVQYGLNAKKQFDQPTYSKYKKAFDGLGEELKPLAEQYIISRTPRYGFTKEAWLENARQIGAAAAKNGVQDLEKAAHDLWFEFRPNTKGSLNRQGKGFVKFDVTEFTNEFKKGALQVNPELGVDKAWDSEIGQFVDLESYWFGNPELTIDEVARKFYGKEAPTPIPRGDTAHSFGKNTVGAAESNPASYDAMQNRYGTIKPGELPHAREVDVPKSTDGQNKVRQYTRTLMEAPATPDEMIPLFEQHVQEGLFSYNPRKNATALDAAVKSITDKGYAGALEQWSDVSSGHKVASKDDMVLGQVLYSVAAKNGDTETAMKLAAELAVEGTRLGDGLQALRMLKKTTPEGKLYYMQKSVENIKQDLVRKYGKNAPDIKIDDSLVKNYSDAMKTGDQGAMDTALDAIEQHVADQIPATFMDKWNAWRYFSMLGNPRTHIRNVVGNALFYGTTKAKNGLAAAIEEGVDRTSRAMGRGGIERSKTLMKTPESVEFAKQDVTEMLDVLQGGGKYNPSDAIRDKRAIFNTKWLEKTRKGAMDALEVEDLWFLKPHYIDSMAGYLSANKIDPAKITDAQLETARSYAIKEAQRATFRDASAAATGLNKLSKTNAATHLIVEGVIPFKKTPINIAKRAVEYSPAGLIKFAKETLIDVPKGNKTAAEAIDTLASGLTGSAIMALGYWLASSGIITAGNDEDAKQQGFDNLTGGQNYALNIGDSSYTLDWAAPSAIPLFMGAEYFNRKGEDLSAQELVNSLLRVGDPLIEMSMLQGLEGAIRTAAYSQSPLADIPVNALASYASQGVPTLFGQVSRTIDDTRRITYVEKGDIKPISATLQKAQAKIPFASQGLTPRIDAWGREVKQQGSNALSRAVQNMLSPGYYSKSKKTAVDSELERLYKQGVEHNPYPQIAARYFYDDGETINLTAKEWEAYAKEKGQQSLQLVTDIMETPYYKNATDNEKSKLVSDVYSYANALAKSKVSDYELDGWMAKAQSSPVSVDEYIVQRNQYNDFDSKKDKGGKVVESASDQYRRALFADSSLSASEKASLDRDLTGSKNVPDYSSQDSFLLSQLTDAQQERYEKYNRGMLTAENYYEITEVIKGVKTKAEKLERIESLGYSKQQARQIYARILSK